MKYAKAFAVVAGSVAALGATATAHAATPTAPSISLTGGMNELTSTVPQVPDRVVNPVVDAVGQTAGAVREDGTVSRSADAVADSAAPLLGGLPLGG